MYCISHCQRTPAEQIDETNFETHYFDIWVAYACELKKRFLLK